MAIAIASTTQTFRAQILYCAVRAVIHRVPSTSTLETSVLSLCARMRYTRMSMAVAALPRMTDSTTASTAPALAARAVLSGWLTVMQYTAVHASSCTGEFLGCLRMTSTTVPVARIARPCFVLHFGGGHAGQRPGSPLLHQTILHVPTHRRDDSLEGAGVHRPGLVRCVVCNQRTARPHLYQHAPLVSVHRRYDSFDGARIPRSCRVHRISDAHPFQRNARPNLYRLPPLVPVHGCHHNLDGAGVSRPGSLTPGCCR